MKSEEETSVSVFLEVCEQLQPMKSEEETSVSVSLEVGAVELPVSW